MKRFISLLLMTAVLCLLMTGFASAANGSGATGITINPWILVACLAVGFLLALIPMGRLKAQIRNVHNKYEATDYTRDGSFELRMREDIFRNRTVTKTPIPKNNDNH